MSVLSGSMHSSKEEDGNEYMQVGPRETCFSLCVLICTLLNRFRELQYFTVEFCLDDKSRDRAMYPHLPLLVCWSVSDLTCSGVAFKQNGYPCFRGIELKLRCCNGFFFL